uniref:Putative secreted protein n=1 Tax=Ixodes scapularis TaxID=6945 RepID=A0A4D5RF94_IXOSC
MYNCCRASMRTLHCCLWGFFFFFLFGLHRAYMHSEHTYVAALYTSNFTQFSKWCVKLCGFIILENVLNVTCFISLNNKVFPS